MGETRVWGDGKARRKETDGKWSLVKPNANVAQKAKAAKAVHAEKKATLTAAEKAIIKPFTNQSKGGIFVGGKYGKTVAGITKKVKAEEKSKLVAAEKKVSTAKTSKTKETERSLKDSERFGGGVAATNKAFEARATKPDTLKASTLKDSERWGGGVSATNKAFEKRSVPFQTSSTEGRPLRHVNKSDVKELKSIDKDLVGLTKKAHKTGTPEEKRRMAQIDDLREQRAKILGVPVHRESSIRTADVTKSVKK